MDERAIQLGERKISQLLWQFSLPAIIGMLANSSYMIINRLFIGNVVGADAISGLSVTMPISLIMTAFGMLIGIGAGAMISIRLGQNRAKEAEHILGNALSLLLIISVLVSGTLLLWLDELLIAFGASPNTLPYGRQFISIILFGSLFQYVSFGLVAIIRSEGNPRISMNIMLLNAGLNVVLDFVFVYLLHWGMPGTAVATVISQAVAATLAIRHFIGSSSVIKLHWKFIPPSRPIIQAILSIGMAPFAMQLVSSLIVILYNQGLAQYGGDSAIGAFGIIYTITMFTLMPVVGISQGLQPIAGFNFGARKYVRVKQSLKLAILFASFIVSLLFILIQLGAGPIMRSFSSEQELLNLGIHGLRVFLLCLPIIGFQIISANFFQAIGKGFTSMFLNLLRQVIFLIPMLLIFPHFFQLNGIWLSSPVSDLAASSVTALVLLRHLRKLDINRDQLNPQAY
ncbi:MAG: MATE family efflux transporter [Syntrophomonadaceae bacterium]|jgi:putative MATE family efflux protein|nr:MATE family efflux transporter [Syntrophomonadaceae bacterium]